MASTAVSSAGAGGAVRVKRRPSVVTSTRPPRPTSQLTPRAGEVPLVTSASSAGVTPAAGSQVTPPSADTSSAVPTMRQRDAPSGDASGKRASTARACANRALADTLSSRDRSGADVTACGLECRVGLRGGVCPRPRGAGTPAAGGAAAKAFCSAGAAVLRRLIHRHGSRRGRLLAARIRATQRGARLLGRRAGATRSRPAAVPVWRAGQGWQASPAAGRHEPAHARPARERTPVPGACPRARRPPPTRRPPRAVAGRASRHASARPPRPARSWRRRRAGPGRPGHEARCASTRDASPADRPPSTQAATSSAVTHAPASAPASAAWPSRSRRSIARFRSGRVGTGLSNP